MDEGTDTSKQAILARLVAAETDAQQKMDAAAEQARQTVAAAKQYGEEMVAQARKEADSAAARLAAARARAGRAEIARRREETQQRDAAMEYNAHAKLDAATTLIVDWVTQAGGDHGRAA